jgi:hypothetical protein
VVQFSWPKAISSGGLKMSETHEVLEMRVARLEAQARRWKTLSVVILVAVILVAGVFVVFIGANRSETADSKPIRARMVEAQIFLLKDANGRVRARLRVNQTAKPAKVDGKVYREVVPGEAVLQFFDETGEEVWKEPRQPTFEQVR